MKKTKRPLMSGVRLVAVGLSCLLATAEAEYDKSKQLFTFAPDPETSVFGLLRFGPVGMSIDLVKPDFTMKVKALEPGGPAEKSGGLKPGQFIHTINGWKPGDLDPRIEFGNLITEAEATDGKLRFMVADTPDGKATEVVVEIPVLGAFSETWPLDCPKSDKIVRDMAAYLKSPGAHKGFADIGMLFLLSTGDPDDLEFVKRWARSNNGGARFPWHIGYGGLALCEYYLRTGDDQVMPAIQRLVDSALEQENFGGWGQRIPLAHVTYGGGGGHLNAAGTLVVATLLLGKECGAEIPGDDLERILAHWYRWAGRGCNSYGNGRPETSFVDNGKNGKLAFTMAAAAALTPDGENSIYAKARDVAAKTSFYTTGHMLHGHTGGGIGEIWRSNAMGLLHEKQPDQYRSFMKERRWHYELSRRFDGSFAIFYGARYDNVEWGAGYALTFTVPRKTLRLTGAPPTKFSKPYELPARPWGTAADDAFVSLEPVAMPDGSRGDFSGETVARDTGNAFLKRLTAMGDIPDDELRRYVHHPDFLIRRTAAHNTVGFKPSYMGNYTGDRVRPELVNEFIGSKDPRVRYAILSALVDGVGNRKARTPEALATKEEVRSKCFTPGIFDLAIQMLKDPEESWYVKDAALQLVGLAPADWVVPQVDLIIPFLKHEEWWLQNAAVTALAPVVSDERVYRKVLPPLGEFARTCPLFNAVAPLRWGALVDNLKQAPPEVAALARETLKDTYVNYVASKSPNTDVRTKVDGGQRGSIVTALTAIPGGYDVLYEVARQQFPTEALPHEGVFLGADPEQFGPELKKAIAEITREKLIYIYMGKSRARLQQEAGATVQDCNIRSIQGLVDLYKKCGVDDYDWKVFGPDLYDAEWNYFTFDPPEKQEYDASPWRFREVTLPKGMEEWNQPGFDPVKAGWEKGQLPIGQFDGKLVTDSERCSESCRCKDPMRSLWEKECLLLTGTFKFPELKEGHLYRIRTGIGQHVGSGDGRRIYINGRLLFEAKAGNGRRAGGVPRGALITKDFMEEFKKGEVTISVTTFLRYGKKAIVQMPPVPQGILSVWVEELKVPPLEASMFQKSATLIPMVCSEWQAVQGPDFAEVKEEDVMFHYDGKFVPNEKLQGSWKAVAQVASVEGFDPAKPIDANRAWLKEVTFNKGGTTDSETVLWSGGTLMDLQRYQALKMTVKTIAGDDYLFVEAGGFSEKHGPDWKTPLMVLKR